MIDWRETLYLDEQMARDDRISELKEMLMQIRLGSLKLLVRPAYGVFLAQNPENLLEIISFSEFLQPGYGTRTFHCVGVASNHDNAERLVQAILMDTLRERGDLQVREFLYPIDKEGEASCCK